MTPLKRDLDATIAHVVGQGLLGMALGCEIHLAVDLSQSGKSFDGRCWVRHPDGDPLPAPVQRAIGVAGRIAELALERGLPDDLEAEEVFDTLSDEPGGDYTLADVALALDTLRSCWKVLAAEVARMAPAILNNILTNKHQIH